jgi:uncharacterized cupin superfamily protein
MSLQLVKEISKSGEGLVPDLSDYSAASEGWAEAEYRADASASTPIVGFWEGKPGWVAFDAWPYTEICVIIRGRVAIEDEHGDRREFADGSAFIVPQGFRGRWHTLEPTTKYFVGVTSTGE